MGRPNLLWTVNDLARNVTKRNVSCDKRLHRLISYIECTKDWAQTCIAGDRIARRKIGYRLGLDRNTVEHRWDVDGDFRRRQQQAGHDRDGMIAMAELGLSLPKKIPMTVEQREQ